MTVTVFLDGLYQIGYSFAQALPKDIFELQAFDPDGMFLRKLKNKKLIKKSVSQIAHGCKGADIIIINQPVDFLELHYEAIGLNIKPGAYVIDTTPAPLYAGKLAEKFLPPETGFASLIPSFKLEALKEQHFHQDSASEDLFKGSTIAISSPSMKLKDAEQVAAKIAAAVGGTVVFMDPYEAQEAMIKTQLMPKYVAAAMIKSLNLRPSWRDEQRVASSDYYQTTSPLMGIFELEQPELAALENKESLARMLDEVLAELQGLRDLIAEGKQKTLHEYLQEAIELRAAWQGHRERNSFDGTAAPADLPKNDMMQQMFLGGLGKKRNLEDE